MDDLRGPLGQSVDTIRKGSETLQALMAQVKQEGGGGSPSTPTAVEAANLRRAREIALRSTGSGLR
eukprot:1879028-Alexandrium_andersonii.AAC.1